MGVVGGGRAMVSNRGESVRPQAESERGICEQIPLVIVVVDYDYTAQS